MHRPGVAVGHDHLVDGRAVQDRADAAPVVVAEGVQDQALVLLHRDAERPLLPAHEVALDGEARSLALADLERLQVCAQRSDVVGEVARVLGRQWHHAGVDDLEHLAPRHVDEREQPFDRARVAVVGRRLAEERDAPADAPALLERQAEVARGPRVDLDEVEVGDAALLERGDVVGVCLQAEDGVERLLEQQPGPHPGHLRPRPHLARRDRHDRLDQLGDWSRDDRQAHLAVDRVALGEREQHLLRRLVETDAREPGRVGDASGRPHRLDGSLDLACAQHVQRVRHRLVVAGFRPWVPGVRRQAGSRSSHQSTRPGESTPYARVVARPARASSLRHSPSDDAWDAAANVWAASSQSPPSAGAGNAVTWRALNLIASAASAAPAWWWSAHALSAGEASAAATCQRRPARASTVIVGTDGSQSPISSTTGSSTRVWVASTTLGTSRALAQLPSELSARRRVRSTRGRR